MRLFERVHHRAFDLRQMQFYLGISQSVVDRLNAFERRRVDAVDGLTHQDKVPQFGLFRDLFDYELLQPAGVEIGQAFVDTDRQDARVGEHLVAFDIAEMFSFGNSSDNGRVRA